MADIMDDSPDVSDMKSDPAGSAMQGASFAVSLGIFGTLALVGYNWIAKPAFSAANETKNAISNATENADTSTFNTDDVF